MIKFFIDGIKAINLLALFIITVGVFYFYTGQKEGFPNIGLDIVIVSTSYPGLSSEEIEANVTRKLEDVIDNVEGKDTMTSYSSEGNSTIVFQVDLDAGRPMNEILDDITSAVDTVKRDLPTDAEDPVIRELTFQNINPMIRAGVSGDIPIEEMKDIIDKLYDDFANIEGVGKVEKASYPNTQVWIEVDPKRLELYDLEISDVKAAVRDNNIILPAGKVTINNSQYLIKTMKKFRSLEDIEKVIVRGNDAGQVVLIRDIAKVGYSYEELPVITRFNGSNSMWIKVYQTESGDIISIADEVKKTLERYKEEGIVSAGMDTHVSDDLSFFVKRRLGILAQNASVGLFLVFLCLIVFFEWRVTFWTTLGIPFSFCLAVITTYSFGISLNLMSMFGFIIVLGMIVDDAIIVAENVYQRVEKGEKAYDAAIKGTKDMLYPLIAITATTVAAFLPLVTLPGIFGKVLGIIPQVVIITMLASFVECIFVLPGHLAFSNFATAPIGNDPTAPKKKQTRRWFNSLKAWYMHVTTKLLKRPVITMLVITVVFGAAAAFSAKNVGFKFFPGAIDEVNVRLEMPISNSIEKTVAKVDEVEAALRNSKVDQHTREYISTAGEVENRDGGEKVRSYLANIDVVFDPDMEISADELTRIIKDEVAKIDGIEKFSARQIRGGPPAGSPVDISFYGKNVEDLEAISSELETYLNETKNLTSVKTSIGEGKDELIVSIDALRASISGMSVGATASALRNAFSGSSSTVASSIDGNAEDIDIVVKYPEKQINDVPESLETIKGTLVKNRRGFNVPLQNYASIEANESFDSLTKAEKKIFVSVDADLENSEDKENNATVVAKKAEDKAKQLLTKYPGISYEMKGEQESQAELARGTIIAVLLAVTGIFFVLTVVFKSYLQPFMIMAILPYMIFGVLIGNYLNNTKLGLMTFLGTIALTGIVVNDSLVMVDTINKLRRGGMEKMQAIIEGATSRLRPIIMTSLTTIVGIAPLAYGILGSEPFLAPMAITLLSGLFFTLFFLLFLFPSIYLAIDNMASWVYRKVFRSTYEID